MSLEESRTQFGDVRLESLLQPAILEKIFSAAPTRKP